MGDLQTRDDATPTATSRLSLPLRPGEVVDGKARRVGIGKVRYAYGRGRVDDVLPGQQRLAAKDLFASSCHEAAHA